MKKEGGLYHGVKVSVKVLNGCIIGGIALLSALLVLACVFGA